MNKKLLIFYAFHYDVAYRKTFEEYLYDCTSIIDTALDFFDESPEFIFCIEQIILLDAYWKRNPKNRKRIKKYAKENRLIFCPGMWTMPDGNIPSAESYYQNFLLGYNWLRKNLEVQPGPICWMADIFGHNAQSPQIYKQLGYKMYMFERGQLENEEIVDFFWEGIDGTTLLTHWEIDTYYGLNIGLAWLGNRSEEYIIERLEKEVIKPLEKNGNNVIFSKIGGDFLKPQKQHLEFIGTWNKKFLTPKIEFAHPDLYISEIGKKDLKIIKTEFNPLKQGTYSSRIRIKQYNRILENFIYTIETLNTIIDGNIPKEINTLWKLTVTNQFHDIICGTLCDKAWRQALKNSKHTYFLAQKTLRKLLGKGENTIIFNPLPYSREEVVKIKNRYVYLNLKPMEINVLEKIEKVKNFTPVKVENRKLSNGLLSTEIDEFGRLSSLTDLTTGIMYYDERFGYIHDIFLEPDYGSLWTYHKGPPNCSLLHIAPYYDPVLKSGIEVTRSGGFETRGADSQCFNFPEIKVCIEKNGYIGTITAKHTEEGYTVHYTINAGEKFLRIKVEHNCNSVQHRIRAIIPTGILKGTIRREIPAGWVEQKEGEYPTQNWVDYSDSEKGICVLNKGIPGNNVTDGVIMLSLFRSVAMIEPKVLPDYEIGQKQYAEYAICPFKPKDPYYDPTRLGYLFNNPSIVMNLSKIPKLNGLQITLEGSNAEIMAFRKISKGCVEIRIYNSSKEKNLLVLHTSKPIISAEKVTPLGKIINKIEIENKNEVKINLNPFEISTLKINYL